MRVRLSCSLMNAVQMIIYNDEDDDDDDDDVLCCILSAVRQ